MKSLAEAAEIIRQRLALEPDGELIAWLQDIHESDACCKLLHELDQLPESDPIYSRVTALLAGIRIGIEMEKP